MSTFFKQLSEDMLDRQEVRMNVKKIGDDIVVMIVPNYKDDGKTIQMSGSPEEVDNGFFNELKNFQDSLTQGLETSVIGEDEEENIPAGSEKGREIAKAKKQDVKKSTPKKAVKKEETPSKAIAEPVIEAGEEKPEETTETEVTEELKKEEPAPVQDGNAKFEELMAEGKSLFENRSYEAAANKYKEALELKPDDAKALSALQNAEKWHKAISRLSNV
jgi:hypothetical protein